MPIYIDPGTGSMLFTILIGVLGTVIYALRELLVKLRFKVNSGSAVKKGEAHFPVVIFSDSKRYWNVFEPICDEFEKRQEKIEYLTSSPDDPALEAVYEYVKCRFIGEGNKAFAALNMLEADIVLSTTPSLDVFYWKRSKNVKWYVHIGHAAGEMSLYRMFGIDYYDAVLTSGKHQEKQIRDLEKIRGLPEKEIVETGITYLDTMKARLDQAGEMPEHEKTVLLAPSWGNSAIFAVYGGDIIKALLETGYHIIVRPHPQSYTAEKERIESLMAQFPENEQLEWNRDNDNFEVLRRSDIMISDFSGVIFDFTLVFDKPIIYADTHFDKAPYDASWLEDEPWTFGILPELGPQLTREDLRDMRSLIEHCLNSNNYKQGREKARREGWAYPGECAVRAVDYLLQKKQQIEMESAKS